ncbi:MAG: hypothetical protein KJ737_08335 [Proteobacteria bacterium]|nr:hypothetical protein [Pseudomonadota bacterium]
MTDNEKNKHSDIIFVKQPSSADIRGRQSVRATFKLTTKAIHAITIVSVHLGIKQKSLFDLLFEDTQILNHIASGLTPDTASGLPRVQKTFVLSRKTLNALEAITQNSAATRDSLVEYTINRLESIITVEKEKHRIRKALLEEFEIHCKQGKKILRKALAHLGDEDPVCHDIQNAVQAALGAHQNIEKYIDKGNIIEDY